jgi:hypothetical protein
MPIRQRSCGRLINFAQVVQPDALGRDLSALVLHGLDATLSFPNTTGQFTLLLITLPMSTNHLRVLLALPN